MKLFATLFFLCTGCFAFSQTVFTVDGFSERYYGEVIINDTSEIFSGGIVSIYDRKANENLISVEAYELSVSLHDGDVMANIKSLPYDEQSLIMYEDYNFDGVADFAIEDGQNSCYHGPSFRIFLAEAGSFSYSDAFTQLAQEYCGMFEVDTLQKKIYTMTKSGCCWHMFSEFIVENNLPKPVKIVTEEYSFPFEILTTETWNGKEMVKEEVKSLYAEGEDIDVVFSFFIPQKEKRVLLYTLQDNYIYYALLRTDSTIEFSYPLAFEEDVPDFKLSKSAANFTLSFINDNAMYVIYEKPGDVGIDITIGGKLYHWQGDAATKKGSLHAIEIMEAENILLE